MSKSHLIILNAKVHKIVEPIKVSDTIEALNHCVCVDFIIDHVMDPLTQKMIQQLHTLLMQGTVDQRKNRVTPGVYRTERTYGRNRELIPAKEVHTYLKDLILDYESNEEIGMTEILDFHVQFEKIFPFEDGNGRVGRLILPRNHMKTIEKRNAACYTVMVNNTIKRCKYGRNYG